MHNKCRLLLLSYHCLCRQVDFALSVYESSSSNQIQAPSAICTMEGNGLSANQRSECTLQPDAALAIAEGALYGLQECSRQLSNRRWNCSYANPLFNNGLQQSKPNYIHSYIYYARITMARACSMLDLKRCSTYVATSSSALHYLYVWLLL